MSAKFRNIYLHRHQCIVFFLLQHMHIVVKEIYHIYMSINKKQCDCEKIQTWSMNDRAWPCCRFLPFVWGDIDAICKVITLRHYFYILGAVVHNISPRLSEKRLHHSFGNLTGKVVIIGCKEAIHTNCNNIVHTEKKRKNKWHWINNYYW